MYKGALGASHAKIVYKKYTHSFSILVQYQHSVFDTPWKAYLYNYKKYVYLSTYLILCNVFR